jgi:hypothetical protein
MATPKSPEVRFEPKLPPGLTLPLEELYDWSEFEGFEAA